uniref:hypothetical protein n=1 Tax=Paenibacillus foliorum TaxID=2654974 RepID=UPI001C10B99A|nr:hypothetical protein [Paenibacillus foliorum]
MNSKAQDKQNQLIENITFLHLVIGVNIAQKAQVACAVSLWGINLGFPLEFGSYD